jgi:hypothetical protein
MKWRMKKNRCFAFLLALLLVFSTANFVVIQHVSATPGEQMILPFSTSWELPYDAVGKENSVDLNFIRDFSSASLNDVYDDDEPVDLPERDEFHGYAFGLRMLKAAGTFGSLYSYCYLNLFDMTPESDAQTPFKIRPHTFISIFYYHDLHKDCMIDAQLYNKRTQQYWSLREFNDNDKYIVDQNGVRIHPKCRRNDAQDSWQFASFDLSIIYTSDPENWYVTKIWIGFDNSISHTTGQAITYFDILHITYGTGQKVHIEDGNPNNNAWMSASIEAWDYKYFSGTDTYTLYLKVSVAAFNDGYTIWPPLELHIFPYIMRVLTNYGSADAQPYPVPTGVNLTREEQNQTVPSGEIAEFVYDIAALIIGYYCPPIGVVLSAIDLAGSFAGLITPPSEDCLYEWPEADWGDKEECPSVPLGNWDPKNFIAGEVYIEMPGLEREKGTHSFEFNFTTDFCLKDPNDPFWAVPLLYGSGELPLNFGWTSDADSLTLPPNSAPYPPSAPSGPVYGWTGRTYTFTTSTTDPEGNYIRYQFDWGDGTTPWTGWYASGAIASASHSWSVGHKIYNIKVRARDTLGKYSFWSEIHQMEIYSGGGGSCPFIYSWDGQQYYFDHEAYPFAVMKSAETTSYDRLKHLKTVDGEYRLKIEQVLNEIDWTDSFELYVVDHPGDDSFVMPDLQGNMHTIKELIQPISAYEKNGDDCLEDVKYLDDKIWKDSIFNADVNDESTLRNWITLTFPKPEGTTEAKLMLSVKKQITITQEWEFFINVIGENYWNLWQKIMENPILTELYLDMYEREISLRIEVWNGTEWVLQDSISAGDALWDDFLAVLDISEIEGDMLQVRLKSTTAHYEINYAGIDYSEDEPMIVNKIDPYYAVKNGEEDISAALESPDENYVTLLPNDVIELRYEAVPESEWKRDFTIAAKGYYNFVDFQDQTFSGFLEGITLWLKGLTEPYFVAKTVFPYLQQMGQ